MQASKIMKLGTVTLGLAVAALGGCSKGNGSNNTVGPSPVATATPVTAVTQLIWKNGVSGTQWLGQAMTLSQSTAATAGAAVTDNVTGDTITLAVGAPAGSPVTLNINATVPVPANVTNYYAAGHVQFDIMLGSAFNAGVTSIYASYGDKGNGNGCSSASLVPAYSLNTSSFVHVSVPFTGFGSCAGGTGSASMAAVSLMEIYVIDNSGFSAGTQFYINNIQWTPN
jgi:hypothetical protein